MSKLLLDVPAVNTVTLMLPTWEPNGSFWAVTFPYTAVKEYVRNPLRVPFALRGKHSLLVLELCAGLARKDGVDESLPSVTLATADSVEAVFERL